MKKFAAIAAILAVGILIGTVVTGTVFAAPGTPTPFTPGAGFAAMGRGGAGMGSMMNVGMEDEVLALLSMTREQVAAERQAGKSLAQIAAAKNVSRDTLINTILAAKRADLNALVTDGKLTQAQADAMYANMQQVVPQMVDSATFGRGSMGRGVAPQQTPRDMDDCPMWDDEQQAPQPGAGRPNNMRPGRGWMRGGSST